MAEKMPDLLRFFTFYVANFLVGAITSKVFYVFSSNLYYLLLANNQFSDKFNNGGGLLSSECALVSDEGTG